MAADKKLTREEMNEIAKKQMLDETDTLKNACPWCNYDNKDESVAPLHKKCDNLVRNTGHKYQCDVCGKNWVKAALNQKYSEVLERGADWERSMKARALRESGIIG